MRVRPRRLRQGKNIRELISETQLNLKELVQPYFLHPSANEKQPIKGFSDVYRWGIDTLSAQIEKDRENQLSGFLLFGGTENKDAQGKTAYDPNSLIAQSVRKLKERFGSEILLFTDVCLCPYTSHGHCGLINETQDAVLNDPSIEVLSKAAVAHAQAGADFVAPSDMMDGRIGAIRDALDRENYSNVGILSYTAKYASSYYGPFREALDSSPQKMDRKSYQMDFRNQREALKELALDLEEGADIIMVKPAMAYLDIISLFRQTSTAPIAAYSVSAEYEMVKRLASDGTVDVQAMAIENLTAIRRAGAQVLFTYFASEIAEKGWLE